MKQFGKIMFLSLGFGLIAVVLLSLPTRPSAADDIKTVMVTPNNTPLYLFTLFILFTCGPFVLTLGAWIRVYQVRQRQWPCPIALIALGIASANAALAAGEFLRLEFLPPSQLPKDLFTLAMLFLLAPISMIVGFFALARGAPKWLICIVEIASVPLLVVGFLASVMVLTPRSF